MTVRKKDGLWYAAILWRSEFRNVLVLHLRKNLISEEDAYAAMQQALRLMSGKERVVDSVK